MSRCASSSHPGDWAPKSAESNVQGLVPSVPAGKGLTDVRRFHPGGVEEVRALLGPRAVHSAKRPESGGIRGHSVPIRHCGRLRTAIVPICSAGWEAPVSHFRSQFPSSGLPGREGISTALAPRMLPGRLSLLFQTERSCNAGRELNPNGAPCTDWRSWTVEYGAFGSQYGLEIR